MTDILSKVWSGEKVNLYSKMVKDLKVGGQMMSFKDLENINLSMEMNIKENII